MKLTPEIMLRHFPIIRSSLRLPPLLKPILFYLNLFESDRSFRCCVSLGICNLRLSTLRPCEYSCQHLGPGWQIYPDQLRKHDYRKKTLNHCLLPESSWLCSIECPSQIHHWGLCQLSYLQRRRFSLHWEQQLLGFLSLWASLVAWSFSRLCIVACLETQ